MSAREWKPGDAYVVDESDCWLWLGPLNRDGYGRARYEGRSVGAHRASYMHHVGPIPTGLVLDHLCRVRHCVNPAHLEPVTDEENRNRGEGAAARALRTGRCAKGHDYTVENTYVRDGKHRRCRTCEIERMRANRQQKGQSGLVFTCPICAEQRHVNSKRRHLSTHGAVA